MPTAEREARFEDLVFDQDARAELLGEGCTGEPWASVPCSAGFAMGGGRVVFEYPGDCAALVRMSAHERSAWEARPEYVRVVLGGEELRRWPVPVFEGGRRPVMLPGDSILFTL